MRKLSSLVTILGIVGHMTATAQTPDFSGVYDASSVTIGASVLSEPDVYPLTPEGDRAFRAYDNVAADRQNADDCAPETIPPILWGRTPIGFSHDDVAAFRAWLRARSLGGRRVEY